MRMMKVDIKAGDTIRFNGSGKVAVTMTAKSGQRARLEISADSTVAIDLPDTKSVRAIVGSGVNLHRR